MRKARTTTELMHGWEGLDYSFRQLVWSGVLLSERASFACVAARGEAQLIEPWIRNALIESFLVNARRMAWFLKRAAR